MRMQWEMINSCPSQEDSLDARAIPNAVLLQTLPIIRLSWPAFWIFHKHPFFQRDPEDRLRKLWEDWSKLQYEVVVTAANWYQSQVDCGVPAASPRPWRPAPHLVVKAQQVGATWNMPEGTADPAHDPCLHRALETVRFENLLSPEPAF
jgi:hypothetical protein